MAPRKPKQPQINHEEENPNAHILGAGVYGSIKRKREG